VNRHRLAQTAAAVLLFSVGATNVLGAPLCRPALAVKDTTFSAIHQWRRTWTAHITVDGARCAAASGHFNIRFVRLKEDAPDLLFTESFTWVPGSIEASTIFAADEAVLRYSVEVEPCRCRE